MPGRTQPFRRRRQCLSASADGSPWGGERGGRHELKLMLRPASSRAVTMPRVPLSGSQPKGWMRGGRACGALWLCVGKGRPGRNVRATVVGEQRQRNRGSLIRLGRSLALPVRGGARGGRHGLNRMLRPASSRAVTMPRVPLSGSQPRGWMRGGQTCGASWLCVGKRRPGRNARSTVVGDLRQRNRGS